MAKTRSIRPPWTADPDCLYAWYSEKGALQAGSAVYGTDNGQLFVTEVNATGVPLSAWDDLEFVGYVRTNQFIGRQGGSSLFVNDYDDSDELMRHQMLRQKMYREYGTIMANKNLFGTSATPLTERHSESPEPRFAVTDFYMEASPYVRHQMWSIRTDNGNKYGIDWRDEGGGITIEIGKINGKPVVLDCFWSNIAMKRVLFYHIPSTMSDKRAAFSFIARRCHQAKAWPEPDNINKPDRKIGIVLQKDDPIFESVACAVEANALEYALLVKREIGNYSSWICESKVFIDLPDLDGRKSFAHLSFDRIDGKLICFWDACSEVFDFKAMADFWSSKKTPTVINMDNFKICKDIIRA